MKRKSLFFTLPLIALVLMACSFGQVNINRVVVHGSGRVKTEERQVKDVERVSMRGTGNLTLIQGDEEGLTIEADENIMPYIETYMEGRELVITLKNNITINQTGNIQYTLKIKDINRVSVSGSGNVTSDKLHVDDLSLEVTGSGNVDLPDLEAKALKARASGSGNFDLKGQVDSQDIIISGAGNYKAGDLQSKDAQVTISGAGEVTVWATEKLDTRITGFGNVSYYGQPNVSQSITGSGRVKNLGTHE